MDPRATAQNALRYAVSLAVLVGVWTTVVRGFKIPSYLLPDPAAVFDTLVQGRRYFAAAAVTTFGNAIAGGVIGVALGFAMGALAAYSKRVRYVIEPYLTIFQSFPREALFPLFVVWLGFGAMPKIVNASLLAFFPMAIVALNSLTDTREDYLRLMESWNASRFHTFVFCRIPAALPSLVGGLRVALPLALIGAVLGEFLGGSGGLGYIIVSSGSAFRVDRTFAAIVVLALGGAVLVAALDAVRFTLLRRYYQR